MAIDAMAVPAHGPILVDGKLTDEVWLQAPTIDEFVQREPKEGAAADLRTEARVAYDAEHLYVAMRAFDPDASQDRRHPDAPRSALAVRLDPRRHRLVLRQALGLRVRRQSGGREDRSLLLQRRPERRQVGRGVGRRRRRRTPTAGAPSSASRSRSCASPASGGAGRLRGVREVGRLNETSTLAAASRNANGIVSQFGELRGLELSGTPKRLELLPYTRRQGRDPEGRRREHPLVNPSSIPAPRSAST